MLVWLLCVESVCGDPISQMKIGGCLSGFRVFFLIIDVVLLCEIVEKSLFCCFWLSFEVICVVVLL